jgi:hypothetical protein
MYTPKKQIVMEDRVTTLKTYDTMVDAMVDQEILQQNNIDCFIGNEQIVELYPMFSDVDNGLKIVVFEKDVERALKLIEEFHKQDNQA